MAESQRGYGKEKVEHNVLLFCCCFFVVSFLLLFFLLLFFFFFFLLFFFCFVFYEPRRVIEQSVEAYQTNGDELSNKR